MQDSGSNDVVRPEGSFEVWVDAQDCPIPCRKAVPKLELPPPKPIRSGEEFVSDASRTMRSLVKLQYHWMHRVLYS